MSARRYIAVVVKLLVCAALISAVPRATSAEVPEKVRINTLIDHVIKALNSGPQCLEDQLPDRLVAAGVMHRDVDLDVANALRVRLLLGGMGTWRLQPATINETFNVPIRPDRARLRRPTSSGRPSALRKLTSGYTATSCARSPGRLHSRRKCWFKAA
jgi:hypothetical protein